MTFTHEVYVVPTLTDEDKMRSSLINSTKKDHNKGVVHHHKFMSPCSKTTKPCEHYMDGVLVATRLS